jgi:hypothetical protein
MNFASLVSVIEQTHQHFQQQAAKAVNISLTVRNWLIGFYIVEFEQNGDDRATYGTRLLDNLASKLNIKGLVSAELSRCRQFYFCYPQILGALTQDFKNLLPNPILGTLSQDSKTEIAQSITDRLNNETFNASLTITAERLLSKLSYSHFVELIKIQDHLKRAFYEVESIQGTWSVRELKRQINSLYFERMGMSKKPELLHKLTQQEIIPQSPRSAECFLVVKRNLQFRLEHR